VGMQSGQSACVLVAFYLGIHGSRRPDMATWLWHPESNHGHGGVQRDGTRTLGDKERSLAKVWIKTYRLSWAGCILAVLPLNSYLRGFPNNKRRQQARCGMPTGDFCCGMGFALIQVDLDQRWL
jgi:hypothetical protein